jgi:c-di-AMP phosphodiesterase-like protein
MNKIFTANTLLAIIGVITGIYVCQDHFVIGAIIISLTFAVLIGAQIVERYRLKKNLSVKKMVERKVASITHDRMFEMPIAIVITSEDGRVLMPNRAFIRQFGKDVSKMGANFLEQIGLPPKKVKGDGTFHELQYEDHTYLMSITEFFRADKRKLLFHLMDVTQLKSSEAHYRHSRTIFACGQIDNYEDLSESLSPQERTELFAQIDVILNRWAQRNDAVLQKFENNHYLAVFSHDNLVRMEHDRFHILDEVRALSRENSAVSLSIGIEDSEEHLSLPELEEGSRSALDIALARGGDQCVVKNDDRNTYYGGETEAKEKRTKVKARIKAQALQEQIAEARNVVIMGHKMPDMDCVGAAIGLIGACRAMNREAKFVLQEINVSIRSLMDYLSKDPNYAECFIKPQEAEAYIEEGTLLIVVDTQSKNYVEMPELVDEIRNSVVIDHHRPSGAEIKATVFSYIEAYASSTCELVCELLQYFNKRDIIGKTEANALMVGMCMDTKMFMSKTGVRTFEAASYLKRKGADTVIAKTMLQNDIETYAARTEAVTNAEFYDNSIAISMYENHNDNGKLIAAQAADELLNIRGIKASFILLKNDDGVCISARSMGEINVQMVLEQLGGGGHMTMAGAQLKDCNDLREGRDRLIRAIEAYKEGKTES